MCISLIQQISSQPRLGQWALLPLSSSSPIHTSILYPAKIIALDSPSRQGPHVIVEWYYGNTYPKEAKQPGGNRSTYPAHRCAHAINDQRGDFSFHDIPAEQVSTLPLSCRPTVISYCHIRYVNSSGPQGSSTMHRAFTGTRTTHLTVFSRTSSLLQ